MGMPNTSNNNGSSSSNKSRDKCRAYNTGSSLKPPYLAHVSSGDLPLLKSEYRRIATQLHPDVNKHPNAIKYFQDLSAEYDNRLNQKQRTKPSAPIKERVRDGYIELNGHVVKGCFASGWVTNGIFRSKVSFRCGHCYKGQQQTANHANNLQNACCNYCNYCGTMNFYKAAGGGILTLN